MSRLVRMLAVLTLSAATSLPAAADEPAIPALATLPPPLREAVLSGRQQTIQNAINTLGQNNGPAKARLASQVAAAGPGYAGIDTRRALAVLGAALDTCRDAVPVSATHQDCGLVLEHAASAVDAASPADAQAWSAIVPSLIRVAGLVAHYQGPPRAIHAALTLVERYAQAMPAEAAAHLQLAVAQVTYLQPDQVPQFRQLIAVRAVQLASRIDLQQANPRAIVDVMWGGLYIPRASPVFAISPAQAVDTFRLAFQISRSAPIKSAYPSIPKDVQELLKLTAANPYLVRLAPTLPQDINAILSGR